MTDSRVPSFTAELASFAATGRLGALRCGASLAELTAQYGAPTAWGRVFHQDRWPRWYSYGSLELILCECRRLKSLSIPVWRGELELPGPGVGELRAVDSRITESRLTAALADADVKWTVLTYPNLHDQRTLRFTPSEGVWIEFVLVDRETYDEPVLDDWLLCKAGFWSRPHDCPKTG
ncbi:hypothetical protein LN042_28000 [Kitasatospora sp. RB6PN24]|uniref:hypothetical protein n=1 Tax=Kitasatospora humi TaxID=2893891 RepID=UPI001E4926D1|nr:hypothetical protein [Kitasatospora humi]MCC9310868.1 hypothetical protein [Kitasatospora humi]